jgi:hypothetical protein
MPTPKFLPGAQLIPLSFSAPAFRGLNTEQGGTVQDQMWATILDNAVYDESGRPAARKGWRTLTTTPGAGKAMRIFEHYQADKTSRVIWSTDSNIYTNTSAPSSIKGTLTITDGNIKFVNFNDKCVAFGIGTGNIPAVSTSGDFADITVNSGTAPTGKIGCSAFGRLWGVDTDGHTVRYSSLLDETRWATDGNGDGGSIDFSKVWPSGQDNIVAIEEFGGDLIVFGSNNTVICTDGQGSALGIDPTAMYVSDTIPGVGAISQYAMCRAAGDLWVLTRFGVVGLRREIVQKSTPYGNVSKNVQSAVTGALDAMADKDDITLEFSPAHSMVVAVFPATETAYTFDTRTPLEDGTYRATSWTCPLQTLTYVQSAANLYGSMINTAGEIMRYSNNDDDGASYVFDYESGWLDLGQEMNVYLKFVKSMTAFMFVTQNVTVTNKVRYDFSNDLYSLDITAQGTDTAEYNAHGAVVSGSAQAEYNAHGAATPGSEVAEYGGGVSLRTLSAPQKGSGQYIKVGLRLDNNSGGFVLQQINLYAKVGRLAT